jgi:Flp pilus assembly pilin Flp
MLNRSFTAARKQLSRLLTDTQGQDLVEYALLVGFMVIAIWVFFPTTVVPSISTIFCRIVSVATNLP